MSDEPNCKRCGATMLCYTISGVEEAESVFACPDCGPAREDLDPVKLAEADAVIQKFLREHPQDNQEKPR